jgi:hypothetical protein
MTADKDSNDTAATPAETAPVQPEAAAVATGAPELPTPPFADELALPPRRTGLVVFVAAALLLLVAAVAGALLLAPLARRTFGANGHDATQSARDAAAGKARMVAAIGLMEALRINDMGAVKPYLSDAAQSAITAEQWSEVASTAVASGVPSATFSPARWAGVTTATVEYDIDGTTGTMSFSPNPKKPNVVTMTESGPDGELAYDIEFVAVGSGWRALSLTPMAETYPLDADFVRSLLDTTPTQ